MNWYFLFKALHFIGFVSWFAGLFYLVRLFVYHREAWEQGEEDPEAQVLRKQYQLMETRLYSIIQNPRHVHHPHGWHWHAQFKSGRIAKSLDAR